MKTSNSSYMFLGRSTVLGLMVLLIVLDIQDTSIGLSSDQAQQIFVEFTQASGSWLGH